MFLKRNAPHGIPKCRISNVTVVRCAPMFLLPLQRRILNVLIMSKSIIKDLSCLLALCFSIGAFIVSLLCNTTYDVDYPSLLVSVLSVLVTALVGWNIYSLVDFNRRKKELMAIANNSSTELKDYMISVERSLWYLYFYLYLGKSPQGLHFEFIFHGLLLTSHFSERGETGKCNTIIDALIKSLHEPQSASILKVSKEQLLKIMLQLSNQQQLPRYHELLTMIAALPTH